MPEPHFIPIPTNQVRALQAGATDANGQPPERHISDGSGVPCRHCLSDVAAGEPFLILAYRPFATPQPYAEIGPIFLHANPCSPYHPTTAVPASFLQREYYLMRGYGRDDRIVYGTGKIVPSTALADAAASLLQRPDVAYAHLRSAAYSCYQCRIELR